MDDFHYATDSEWDNADAAEQGAARPDVAWGSWMQSEHSFMTKAKRHAARAVTIVRESLTHSFGGALHDTA